MKFAAATVVVALAGGATAAPLLGVVGGVVGGVGQVVGGVGQAVGGLLGEIGQILGLHPAYSNTFWGGSCAISAPDYLTYSLQNSISDCLSFCDTVQGCKFANSYQESNSAKGSNKFTCAVYSKPHYSNEATNCGGQDQTGSGKVNTISNSAGWKKN
ncbi:hypothetical protein IE53DRAFT_390840 [Violaceomyces palustris]|uniref:Uncharacterized protein n=1 Tax=Violaceomyces palustris TaxID=1673888 RepID=A0ACD0NMK5_9BASI|nr:hypothetical protein IE53DRAFT_390840 [Violaceomyces palustris]